MLIDTHTFGENGRKIFGKSADFSGRRNFDRYEIPAELTEEMTNFSIAQHSKLVLGIVCKAGFLSISPKIVLCFVGIGKHSTRFCSSELEFRNRVSKKLFEKNQNSISFDDSGHCIGCNLKHFDWIWV